MKLNLNRIFVVFVILLAFVFSNVYAVDLFLSNPTSNISNNTVIETGPENKNEAVVINSNTDNQLGENILTYGNNNVENETIEKTSEYLNSETLVSSQTTSTPTITTTTISDNSLNVSDIINIVLIAVCIVLIFLAIAILIRCK